MTRYSDNIYSGYQGITSASTSKSAVVLRKVYNFAGAGNTTPVTRTGVFPSGTQNMAAKIFITQAASATVSDKITVSAGGFDLVTIDQFGSAAGIAGDTKAGVARFTYIASACASVPVPASTNQGDIPFAITFVPVSADKVGTYVVELTYNRSDSNTLGVTA